MKVFQYLDRISLINKLLIHSCTGTPEELARQLGISRTSLYELLDELKSRGAPILYSKSARTFYYSRPYEILVTCNLRPLTVEEVNDLSGGNLFSRILFFRTLLSEFSTASLQC